MKVLLQDLKHNKIKLLTENIDDLWHLYNLISPGDKATAKTSRAVKQEKKGERPKEARRKAVTLTIQVDKTSFDRVMNRLRINGIIVESPEEIEAKGKHHSLNISEGHAITIEKYRWMKHHLKRINNAKDIDKVPIIILAIDDQESGISVLRRFGFDEQHFIRANLAGKLEPKKREKSKKEYFNTVSKDLSNTWKKHKSPIVIVGPGFIKNEFANYIKAHYTGLSTYIASIKSVSYGGLNGVYEALRVGIIDHIAKNIRAREETKIVEDVLKRLGQDRRDVTYGLDDVNDASNYNSIEKLIVSVRLLREANDEKRIRLEDIMNNVESHGGNVMLISDQHEAGNKLNGLGGIAAILRYNIE
jgi:protein pelota